MPTNEHAVDRELDREFGADNWIQGGYVGVAEAVAIGAIAIAGGTAVATDYAESETRKLGGFGVRALAWACSKGDGRLVFGKRSVTLYERPFGKSGPKITVNNKTSIYAAFIRS